MSHGEYLPLKEYGLVGDGRSAALVSREGSVDWLCTPRFDSPSLFARLLDHRLGGYWRIGLARPGSSEARYRPRTAILETEHRNADGAVRVSDFFVPPLDETDPVALVRLCEGLAGEVELESVVDPRPDFGRGSPTPAPAGVGDLLLGEEGRLRSSVAQQERRAELVLRQGERAAFILEDGPTGHRLDDVSTLLEAAASDWQAWSDSVEYSGPHSDVVGRSALTLRLLAYAPTGALVSAPTTSLPARVGGDANWDYRYAWLRDSALSLYALYAIGVRAEGDAFFDWICARVGESAGDGGLRVMYDVDGGSDHEERVLDHLEGYERSRPVRVGNAACMQVQMDVYGEVLDLFSSACAWGRADKLAQWPEFRRLADWICERWADPDSGIWEQRGPQRHHVYSKAMAWVALDRAHRLASTHRLEGDLDRWAANARALRLTVMRKGWSDRREAFAQSFDDDRVDAANLLIPLVGLLPPEDPRALSNLARIREQLESDGLVFRFRSDEDELTAGEGAFLLCSFWLVNALTAVGRLDDAVEVFERACARASPLGLFAEHVDVASGRLLGNYPQAFVHAGAVTAAVNLARLGVGEAPAAEGAPEATGHLVKVPMGF